MKLPPVDLSFVLDRFTELAEQIDAVSESTDDGPESPIPLSEAMLQLLDLLARIGEDRGAGSRPPDELTTYGDYGLHLLDRLAEAAMRTDREDLAEAVEQLSLSFSLWVVRNGGELRQLRAVANALARAAGEAQNPSQMADLYSCSCELIDAASLAYENRSVTRPAEPWRQLLLNRAIIATRSHNPELIEPAFDAIVEQLPSDAEQFFAEGIEQITVIDYPDPVCDLVRRYFLTHGKPRHLH